MTVIHYDNGERVIVLETARDWPEVVDHIRQKWHGDLPAKDERFEAARAIMKEAAERKK